jgi:hypothetical protein
LQHLVGTEVGLNLRSDLAFVPLATSFVENAARSFGLGEPEILSLTLATEEIFSYLCEVTAPDKGLEIHCRAGGYYVDEEFLFEAHDFNMRAFNITSSASLDDQDVAPETGLLIASRMVDRFRFFEEGNRLHLILTKEKTYPGLPELQVPDARPLEEFSVRTPNFEELKILVRMVNQSYSPPSVPRSFSFPGKVVDMAESGAYHAVIAADKAGHIGGGLIWRWETQRLVEFFGPYLLRQPPESSMAQALVDACISSIARSRSIGLINRYPTPELPKGYFESLGSLTFRTEAGVTTEIDSCYRHLEEDAGLAVWAHPSFEGFLDEEYRRLVFAREIRLVRDEGERSSPYSVLSAKFDRSSLRVTLQPIWFGLDAHETVSTHVETLRKEKIPNIFFEMDLGKAWQCLFAPALFGAGFEPRLVLPYSGQGDLVVFQCRAGA